MRKFSPVFLGLLFALSACGVGSEEASGGTGAESVSDLPECSEVWVVGETLSSDYEDGCIEGDTQLDAAFTPCADGKTRLFIHQTETGENTHFAITGSPIQSYTEEAKSEAYFICQPAD